MMVADCSEKLESELLATQFIIKEAREYADHLQWELQVEQRSHEQAEAEGSSLNQQIQMGSKSKELKCLLTAEAENTKEIRWLIMAELESGQKQEDKLTARCYFKTWQGGLASKAHKT